MPAAIQRCCHLFAVILVGMFTAMVWLRLDLRFFQLSSTEWTYRARMKYLDQLCMSSFTFDHRALEKINIFLGNFLLMNGDCVLSSNIALSWSVIPGPTVVVLTRVGRLVMRRSRTLSPLVGSIWVWVRWNSNSISMQWLYMQSHSAPCVDSFLLPVYVAKVKISPQW